MENKMIYLLPTNLIDQIKNVLSRQPICFASAKSFPNGRIYYMKEDQIYTRLLDENKKSIAWSEMIVKDYEDQ